MKISLIGNKTREQIALENGYKVSLQGEVTDVHGNTVTSFTPNKNYPYKAFKFHDEELRNGEKPITVYIHKLMWLEHKGLVDDSQILYTINGNAADCRLDNLALRVKEKRKKVIADSFGQKSA